MAIFLRTSLLFFLISSGGLFSLFAQTLRILHAENAQPETLEKLIPSDFQTSKTSSLFIFTCPLSTNKTSILFKWGLCNEKGNIVLQPVWDSIGSVSKGVVEVFQYIPQRRQAPLCAGLISLQANILLPVQYKTVRPIHVDYYRVDTGTGYSLWHLKKGFLNRIAYDSICVTTSGIVLYTEAIQHRLDTLQVKIEQKPCKQWSNNTCTLYDSIFVYRSGDPGLTVLLGDSVLDASSANKLLLYRNGNALTWNLMTSIAQKTSPLSQVRTRSLKTLSDSTQLKIKSRTQADSIVLLDSWFLYSKNKLWGYGDTLGNIPIAPQYQALRFFYNNRVAVKYRNKWGFLDREENFILQPYYEEVGDFIHSGTWVRQGEKYNFVDLQGKVLNSNWYERIQLTAGGNYLVTLKNKMGLVNKNGKEIIGTRYLQLMDFGDGACLAQAESGKWLLLDYSENRISTLYYTHVRYLPLSKTYVLMK